MLVKTPPVQGSTSVANPEDGLLRCSSCSSWPSPICCSEVTTKESKQPESEQCFTHLKMMVAGRSHMDVRTNQMSDPGAIPNRNSSTQQTTNHASKQPNKQTSKLITRRLQACLRSQQLLDFLGHLLKIEPGSEPP